MISICEELDFAFTAGSAARATNILLTGHSCRCPVTVDLRPRRKVSCDFFASAVSFGAYRNIAERFCCGPHNSNASPGSWTRQPSLIDDPINATYEVIINI